MMEVRCVWSRTSVQFIPSHFRRNSLCAYGEIRMFSSQNDAKGCEQAHVRAVNLGPQVEEFCQNISDLSSRTAPLSVTKNVTEVITMAHTVMVPPEILGYFLLLRMSPKLSYLLLLLHLQGLPVFFHWFVQLLLRRQLALQLPAADGEAELPESERENAGDPKEVYVNGVMLDTNTPLRVFRDACESLGLAKRGGKATCLARLWHHLEQQELIVSQAAERERVERCSGKCSTCSCSTKGTYQ